MSFERAIGTESEVGLKLVSNRLSISLYSKINYTICIDSFFLCKYEDAFPKLSNKNISLETKKKTAELLSNISLPI